MATTTKKNANASVQRKKRSLVTVLTSALAVAAVCGVIVAALVFTTPGEEATATKTNNAATTFNEQEVKTNADTNTADESCEIQKCKAGGSEVCGTNGITYLNECFFSNAQCKDPSIQKVQDWKGYNCPHKCKKQIACNEVGIFLCASDGNVYFGYCNLYIAQCLDPSITEVECDKTIFDGMFKRPQND